MSKIKNSSLVKLINLMVFRKDNLHFSSFSFVFVFSFFFFLLVSFIFLLFFCFFFPPSSLSHWHATMKSFHFFALLVFSISVLVALTAFLSSIPPPSFLRLYHGKFLFRGLQSWECTLCINGPLNDCPPASCIMKILSLYVQLIYYEK